MLSQFSSERIDSKRFNVENSLRLCITSLNLDSLHVIPSHCSTFAMQGLFFFFSSSPVFLAGRDLFPHGIQSPSDYPAIDVITSIKMPREKKKTKTRTAISRRHAPLPYSKCERLNQILFSIGFFDPSTIYQAISLVTRERGHVTIAFLLCPSHSTRSVTQ